MKYVRSFLPFFIMKEKNLFKRCFFFRDLNVVFNSFCKGTIAKISLNVF
jgi:hypothetical protein